MSVYRDLAAHAGAAYLRYSFTKGTEQEVGFLVDALDLRPGQRVLDAGCGPGRHAHALASRGVDVVGVDLAFPFLEVARDASAARAPATRAQASPGPADPAPGAPAPSASVDRSGVGFGPEGAFAPPNGSAAFVQGDVRHLPVRPGSFDAVVCLCQGGFGLLGGGDGEMEALRALASVLRLGGRLALTAFSSWYAVKWSGEGETFDAGTAVLHETARVRGRNGAEEAEFPLDHTCFTPRELRMMAAAAGLQVEAVWSVEPGQYAARAPEVDRPEWLMVAQLVA